MLAMLAAFCISEGCVIHPQVLAKFGIPTFHAPPTNFTGITNHSTTILGAAFLTVGHPHHPEVFKSDRQLFYIVGDMQGEVTLSMSCCKNLGIIPPEFPVIGKAAQEEKTEVGTRWSRCSRGWSRWRRCCKCLSRGVFWQRRGLRR